MDKRKQYQINELKNLLVAVTTLLRRIEFLIDMVVESEIEKDKKAGEG